MTDRLHPTVAAEGILKVLHQMRAPRSVAKGVKGTGVGRGCLPLHPIRGSGNVISSPMQRVEAPAENGL